MMHGGINMARWHGAAPLPPIGTVSDRQLAVLEQLAAGRSYVQVAQALGLFPGMVEFEIDNMRRKFGARSTHNLITMALTRGIAA